MPNQIIKLSKQEFDSLKLLNNNVAIEITHRNSEQKTKSGLILVQDPNMLTAHSIESAETYDESQHLDRWGIVAKLPEKLKYAKTKKMSGMDWETEIEIQIGDYVWADYYNLHHCPVFRVHDGESYRDYWSVTYDCLVVAKRKKFVDFHPYQNSEKEYIDSLTEIVIPLNGYCLFTQINEGLQSKFLILEEKINKSKGIVKYTGSKNKNYNSPKKFDDIDINPGDEVIFRTEAAVLLENSQHRFFEDCDLRYEQRCNVLAIKTN